MKWEEGQESENVEDRRGGVGPAHVIGGGTIIVLLVGYMLGINPIRLLNQMQGGGDSPPQVQAGPGQHDRARKFISTIIGYTEKVWGEQFRKIGRNYERPHVVIYSGQTNGGCGLASASVGPFYCPEDRTVYVDPAFFNELEDKLGGSKADFSCAYVLAHEVGHHVQTLLGYGELVEQKRRQLSKTEFNRWSVRLELQADYLAGVWAHYGQEDFHFIEPGDLEAALKSAKAIGDDTLQREFNGSVSPQNYTHGTSAQRVKWYRKGFETGDMSKLKEIFEMPYESL